MRPHHRAGQRVLVVGVAVFALSAWGRPGGPGSSGFPGAFVVVLGLVAVIMAAIRLRHRVRREGVRLERPGAVLWQVWADAGLGHQLAQLGVAVPRLTSGGGTPMTLAVSLAGVELWRGGGRPHLVVQVPWTHVSAVHAVAGTQNGVQRPAVAIGTRPAGALVLIPARTTAGLLMPASAAQANALVEELRARHVSAMAS